LAYEIPFLVHPDDEFLVKQAPQSAQHFTQVDLIPPPLIDGFLKVGEQLNFAGSSFEIIHTPGHTPGSVSFYSPAEKVCFVGDAIFAGGGIGRYDFEYSSEPQLIKSINRLLSLPETTLIYPGHGPTTTVANERRLHQLV
jgi:hydroxyacylglutathione hydrolase